MRNDDTNDVAETDIMSGTPQYMRDVEAAAAVVGQIWILKCGS